MVWSWRSAVRNGCPATTKRKVGHDRETETAGLQPTGRPAGRHHTARRATRHLPGFTQFLQHAQNVTANTGWWGQLTVELLLWSNTNIEYCENTPLERPIRTWLLLKCIQNLRTFDWLTIEPTGGLSYCTLNSRAAHTSRTAWPCNGGGKLLRNYLLFDAA